MAVTIENHTHEIKSSSNTSFEMEQAQERLNKEMKKILSEKNFEIYKMLFIKNMTDEQVAATLGYKTTETGRKAGYKQIKNLKKQFKAKAEKILKTKDIFYGKD